MPTSGHPVRTNSKGIRIIGQVQGCNSSAAHRGQPYNPNAVLRPAEMLEPGLSTGIEQGNCDSRQRIDFSGFVALMPVANWARYPKIALIVSRRIINCKRGTRNNVFYL